MAAEGWAPVQLWGACVVGVAAWCAAAALLVWLGLRLWRAGADWSAQLRSGLGGGEVDAVLWFEAALFTVSLFVAVAYLSSMMDAFAKLWPWRPWRPHSGEAQQHQRRPFREAQAATATPWVRSGPDMVFAPEVEIVEAAASAPQDAVDIPDDELEGRRGVRADVAEEACEEDQGTFGLASDWEDDGLVVRLLSPMTTTYPALYETLVWCVLHRGVVMHKDMMRATGLSQEAITKRCKRLAREGWLLRNKDRSFRLAPEVMTDVSLLHQAAASGDAELARRIAGAVRFQPLPQFFETWIEEEGGESYRAVVARDAQGALTACSEAFGDDDGVFVRATDAVWDY